jgi:hypothetical protein
MEDWRSVLVEGDDSMESRSFGWQEMEDGDATQRTESSRARFQRSNQGHYRTVHTLNQGQVLQLYCPILSPDAALLWSHSRSGEKFL